MKLPELAEKLQVGYSSIANFASGRQDISLKTLKRIAEILNTTVDEISAPVERKTAVHLHSKELPISGIEVEIVRRLKEGPAGAAEGMEPEELVQRIIEHAEKLKSDPLYMRAAHAEIVLAFALELTRRKP